MNSKKTIDRSRVGKILQLVLAELIRAGGRARAGELLAAVEPNLNPTEHERAVLEKSGAVRWHTVARFYSIPLVKTGYIQKSSGYWIITERGAQSLKASPKQFVDQLMHEYQVWEKDQDLSKVDESEEEYTTDESVRQTIYDALVEESIAEIESHILTLSPYDFQELVAELLRAMGYHIPFIAPPGRDGGIDILAYKDVLGSISPRILVQVKHREQKMTVREVRELEGLIRRVGDMGLLVSRSGFTSEVERELRASTKHIDVMDLDRLIHLWQEHYDKLSESGKALLPLVSVFFLAPPH